MTIVAVIIGLVCGVAGTYAYGQYRRATSRHQSEQTVAAAKNKARAVVLAAKDKALKITDDAKREEAELRKGLKKTEERLAERETHLDKKLDELDSRSEKLRQAESEVEELKNEIRQIRSRQQEKLERIAKLTKTQAAEKLLTMTENDIKADLTELVAKLQRDAMDDAEDRAQTILLTAMERMSSEVTAERTVTALKLTDDEMKGRIIGKEGRNIQAIQRETGVDVLVDDTPGMVVLSSFDPVRRQVAHSPGPC